MYTSLLIPLEGFGPGGHHGGPPPFVPMIGASMFLLFLLIAGALFYVVRRGHFGPPPWAGQFRSSPETEAKKILAERFARGEISTEEFMERASVLNWTPGSEPMGPRKPHKKR